MQALPVRDRADEIVRIAFPSSDRLPERGADGRVEWPSGWSSDDRDDWLVLSGALVGGEGDAQAGAAGAASRGPTGHGYAPPPAVPLQASLVAPFVMGLTGLAAVAAAVTRHAIW